MHNLPTVFQKRLLWTAVSALSLTVIILISVGLVYWTMRVLSVLQPFLVPFALAGVLAYLLEPGVAWLEKRRHMDRQRAVLVVFAAFTVFIVGLGWWLGVKLVSQARHMDGKLDVYAVKVRSSLLGFAGEIESKYGIELVPGLNAAVEKAAAAPDSAAEEGGTVESPDEFSLRDFLAGDWVRQTLPGAVTWAWRAVKSSIGGFLGMFGFLISMVIVPLYLYYFLIESANIQKSWGNYLPLRASAFKDEVVDCLGEINGYLVAFFRGQLFVSVINGVATGIGLTLAGLDFGLIIGLLLCVLGLIPYLGIVLCWIPAVAIASVQGGSALVPADPWWAMPLVVTGIFAVVQQIDSFFISPKVVGDSVGLHPMTVIISMVVWTVLLGGLLGAILAIPMTASLKVLFQRYVWLAKLAPQTVGGAALRPQPTASGRLSA